MDLNIKTLMIPIASSMVGLIPVLINITVNILDKRSKLAKRNNEINYVNQRVMFLTTWYQLQKEVGRPEQLPAIKDLMAQELKDVYEDHADALVESERLSQQRQELLSRYKNTNAFRRFFLLYTPYNVGGWLYHTLYYMSLLPLLVLAGYEVYLYIQTNIWFENELYLYASIVLIVFVILFRMFGRGAAKSTEQRLTTIERKTTPLGNPVASS